MSLATSHLHVHLEEMQLLIISKFDVGHLMAHDHLRAVLRLSTAGHLQLHGHRPCEIEHAWWKLQACQLGNGLLFLSAKHTLQQALQVVCELNEGVLVLVFVDTVAIECCRLAVDVVHRVCVLLLLLHVHLLVASCLLCAHILIGQRVHRTSRRYEWALERLSTLNPSSGALSGRDDIVRLDYELLDILLEHDDLLQGVYHCFL